MARDIHGKEVRAGSRVTVLRIDPSVWEHLPEDEQAELKSMVGEVFEVYEVTNKFASVEKWWRDDAEHSHSHSIALSQDEMELMK